MAGFHYRDQMKRTAIRRVSKKRARELIEYSNIRRRLLSDGAFCEFPDCISRATQIHHLWGRYGAKLIDTKYLMLICQTHHTFIHDHPNTARAMNLLKWKQITNTKASDHFLIFAQTGIKGMKWALRPTRSRTMERLVLEDESCSYSQLLIGRIGLVRKSRIKPAFHTKHAAHDCQSWSEKAKSRSSVSARLGADRLLLFINAYERFAHNTITVGLHLHICCHFGWSKSSRSDWSLFL